ncbi:c-type cytochrome [Sorangium sp. So ce1153]|uniref:c-type cytochrome n=1 Tax=Sorangium sp. So ce1153 TaxID=3133333 RepID=UPI003F610BD7
MKARTRARLAALSAIAATVAGCALYEKEDLSWDSPLPRDDGPSWSGPPPRVSAVPPPPVSGGTLLVTADKKLAVAADPDRDRIAILNLFSSQVTILPLEEGDEPGRVTEGTAGVAHVALRRGGAVVTIDLATRQMRRRPVCPAPRGLAHDASTGLLHVACAGGELVTLSSDVAAPPVRELRLDRDLRDVIVQGDSLLVSRFRSAELLVVAKDGTVAERIKPPVYFASVPRGDSGVELGFMPGVAWRTLSLPGGGVAMVHQRGVMDPIDDTQPGSYYGKNCQQSILHSAVTVMRPRPGEAGSPFAPAVPYVGGIGTGVLPVDIAVSPDGLSAAILHAGSKSVLETPLVTLEQRDALETCSASADQRELDVGMSGDPIAVGYDAEGNLLVQLREPPGIARFAALSGKRIDLIEIPGESRLDDAHIFFHRGETSLTMTIACASCHPEGHEDGRTWYFESIGPRRTQSVAGGVLATAPLHWEGELADVGALIEEVFQRRMGGSYQRPEDVAAIAAWIDTIKDLPRSKPEDEAAAARGEVLFNDPTLACGTCHSGEKLTNGETMDVGTGKPYQVPSLRGLAARAPYMHDGCAATLHDRFGPCGGGDRHGVTSALTPAQIDDLVAYLETL